MTGEQIVRDAVEIWRAGVAAVDSATLVQAALDIADSTLRIGSDSFPLDSIHRILVVGAGKAGAGMAEGLLRALGPQLCRQKNVHGWVNVPDDCAREIPGIRIFAARPPGENLPTPRVLEGTRQILKMVRDLSPNDLCICLISGGGSALLDLPRHPITLTEQIGLIEHLSAACANIQQLNTVRKQLSEVKGGRLAAACAAPLVGLIISDVLGDPLDVIASGPTVADSSTPADALRILRQFDPTETAIAPSIYRVLRGGAVRAIAPGELSHARNHVVGNIGVAIRAAAMQAQRAGYQTDFRVPTKLEPSAEEIGHAMVERLRKLADRTDQVAWIEGGEPVVRLAPPAQRGLGGRNQQVVLAAAAVLLSDPISVGKQFCILSGGTDGEDGPTDAAGAWIDAASIAQAQRTGLNPDPYLQHNDAYHFFKPLGSLLLTGPTHTNVCDLRILVCR